MARRTKDDEETRLRSVALKNSQSILRARRRAEEALREGVRSLEESEAALRESEARYRAIFDGAAVSLWEEDFSGIYAAVQELRSQGVTDFRRYFAEHPEFVERAQGLIRVLDVNDASVRIFEANDKAELLIALPKIFLPETIPVFVEELVTIAEGRSFLQGEALVATLRGNRIWVLFTMSLRPSEEQPGRALFSLLDITERKRAEEALRATEDRLRFVMDAAPQKVFTARPSGKLEYLGPQWSEFSGMSFEQLAEWGWTNLVHPDDVTENVKVWQHSLETGEPFQFEHRLRRADGEYRWHLSRALPMRDSAGRIVLWVGSNTDVHEVKEADRRKDEFLATLAHELRNPLAPIRNALNVLQLKGGSEDVQSASEMMERQVELMVRLVDDLLDASRISRGKIALRRERTELAQVVNHAVEATRLLAQEMEHDLSITLPSRPLYLNADPDRMMQVVANLLSNACKYTGRGGRIRLAVEQEGKQAVLRVQDNGVGIAPDELGRIFDMFMQVDTSLERSVSGLGIGLNLVKSLVELHGGSVEARSDGPGQGSEFVLRLPLMVVEAQKGLALGRAAAAAAPMSPHRILIVDDNRDSAESLATLLSLTGNQTRTAFDGLEAVEAAEAFQPDLVLLDIGLPKLNGYEACRRIREQAWSHGMLLVALTGWGQEEDRSRASDAGFDGYMVKPVAYAALKKLLASLPA